MQGIIPELVVPLAALRAAGRACNGPGDFIENGDDVDGQATADIGAAGLPFEEVETPLAAAVYDDEVFRPAGVGSPLLPLAALLFLGAKDQPAEACGKVAIGQVFGRAAGLAAASCPENTDASLSVRKPEGFAVSPIS